MKSRVILFVLFLTSVFALSLAVAPAPSAAAAVGTTYTVTSASCTGPGSITEAMALANANPGEDTIEFTPGLQIDAHRCPRNYPISSLTYFSVHATESVIFEGNGARLFGHINWITRTGQITPLDFCPKPPTVYTSTTPGFIRVGLGNTDNQNITVTVRNLDMYELNSVARIEKNASLILEDLSMDRILSHLNFANCEAPAIEALEGANFTARRTKWNTIVNFFEIPSLFPTVTGPAIRNSSGGDLTIEDSDFYNVQKSGVILWDGPAGSEVNVVSSRFEATGAIIVRGNVTTNIVNTIWAPEFSTGSIDNESRFANFSNEPMNIVASTILLPDLRCDNDCQNSGNLGWILRVPGAGGKINFKQSAVGVNFPLTGQLPPDSGKLLDPGDGSGFSADEYTWMQPTAWQDATALETATNQTNLLTGSDALRTGGLYRANVWATPLDPGELIDIVPNADCGQANQLLNPIDGTCITKDALGNPRVDANGTRNSGAVQLTLAPHLVVTGTGDQTVDLSWTKPQFSAPTTGITGYELRYRETGAASWTTTSVSGPDTLTQQVTGLTNGTEYEFEVRATYSPSGEGPYSNTVTGTPLGPIGAPVVTATPGNTQVDLSWTKPDDGGHVIIGYNIVWRPVGTTSWTGSATTTGTNTNPPATQTTITGLTNGTEYEFFVTANANGVIGPQGTDTATPFAPGTVVISKLTAPAGGTGFSFTQDIDNSGNFALDDQGSKSFNSVVPGSYTVTEADPQGLGYELTNITCVDGDPNGVTSAGDAATRTATINVDSGETVQCSFNNAQEETVVIEKRTLPPGGSGFTFSNDIAAPASFSLDDAETRTFTSLKPGNYQVTEALKPGYELTAIDCTVEGANVPGDLASRTANISLQQSGGNAHCTFTNTKLGTVIMRKETLPDGSLEAFGYTISGPDYSDSGSKTDGAATQVNHAKPGEWTLMESLPSADWHLGDVSCTSTLGTSTFTNDLDNLKTTVELAPGDTMECTFTNVEDDTIIVEKVTVPAGDPTTSFDFTGSSPIGAFALKDGETQSFSVDAAAGPYTLTENDPSGAGYEVTDIRCVNTQTGETTLGDVATRAVELNTQPGESQHCTFTNSLHGRVVIRKATAAGGGSGFGFYGTLGSFTLDDGQDKTFLDVTPGTYSVSEVDTTSLGYGLSGISCSDSDPNGTPSTGDLPTHTATINVDAGETVECTFTNREPEVRITLFLPVIRHR